MYLDQFGPATPPDAAPQAAPAAQAAPINQPAAAPTGNQYLDQYGEAEPPPGPLPAPRQHIHRQAVQAHAFIRQARLFLVHDCHGGQQHRVFGQFAQVGVQSR